MPNAAAVAADPTYELARLMLRADLKDWLSDVLLDSKSLSRGYFEMCAIEKLLADNESSADIRRKYSPSQHSNCGIEPFYPQPRLPLIIHAVPLSSAFCSEFSEAPATRAGGKNAEIETTWKSPFTGSDITFHRIDLRSDRLES